MLWRQEPDASGSNWNARIERIKGTSLKTFSGGMSSRRCASDSTSSDRVLTDPSHTLVRLRSCGTERHAPLDDSVIWVGAPLFRGSRVGS